MEYGTNKHPPFQDDPPQLIGELPPEHIPVYTPSPPTEEPTDGEGATTHGKRLVVVGDVHGHLAALKALLRRIGFDHKHGDHLILTGDMVTKGPNSKGVAKLAMNLGASAVRGNQDDKVLAFARKLRRVSVDEDDGQGSDDADEDGEDDDDGDEAETATKTKYHARRVARTLSRAQLAWLRSLPIILRIRQLPDATSPPWNASTIAVVHGGLVPGIPLEKQESWAVMNMRSLVYPGHGKGKGKHANPQSESEDDDEVAPDAVAVPIDTHDGEPWSHAWNRYQNNLPPSSPHTVVIYGHNAKKGLQVTPQADISPYYSPSTSSSKKKHKHKKVKGLRYAFGLDSGCGHGRQLTALIIEAGLDGVKHRIEQVECDLEAEERALWEDDDYTPPMPPAPPEEDREEENQRVVD
ncbi:Metallo-dependent phosphatase-like protein [Achaetomium macrosporum]|uniref:Metallo-dependent phosphatase-like protein n=1 Tax=Achaetomium macrosporum TaxID=79813 RepID=A0AAN7HCY0_9PEZI|nr:Metallo-dependent phosphatase-like protein [Achaetomium macrosporum]